MSHTPEQEQLLREKFHETEKNFTRLAYRQTIRQVAGEIFTAAVEPVRPASLVRAYGPAILTQLNLV
jgi:hypothetical protein